MNNPRNDKADADRIEFPHFKDPIPGVNEMYEYAAALYKASEPIQYDRFVSTTWCLKRIYENFCRFLSPSYQSRYSEISPYPSVVDYDSRALLLKEVDRTYENLRRVLFDNYHIKGAELKWYPGNVEEREFLNTAELKHNVAELLSNILYDSKKQIGPGPRPCFAFLSDGDFSENGDLSFEIIEGWREAKMSYSFKLIKK